MAAYIRKLLAFALFAAPVYTLLVVVWGEVGTDGLRRNLRYSMGGYGHLHSRLADLRERDSVEVLVLGSSHAYRGFDPRIFAGEGIDLFVLGGSGMTPLQTEVLLHRHLHQLKPRLVIVEVYPGTFVNEGVESALDLIANSGVDRHALRMAAHLNHVKVWHAFVNGTYRHALGRDAAFVEPARVDMDTYVRGGYVERDMATLDTLRRVFPVRQPPRTEQLHAFERVMALLEAHGVPTVLVEMPVTNKLYASILERAAYDSLFHRHDPYINMQGRVALDDEAHFYDKGHMNQEGVERTNRALIGILRREGLL
jgi:hypothetical protein